MLLRRATAGSFPMFILFSFCAGSSGGRPTFVEGSFVQYAKQFSGVEQESIGQSAGNTNSEPRGLVTARSRCGGPPGPGRRDRRPVRIAPDSASRETASVADARTRVAAAPCGAVARFHTYLCPPRLAGKALVQAPLC